MGAAERWARWRWRRRGAWQWPAFALGVLADAVVLDRLPPVGDGGDAVAAILVAGLVALAVLAVAVRPAAAVLRRRRPDLPLVVARDYAACGLLAATTAVLVLAGVGHRPSVQAARRAFAAQSAAVRRYVLDHSPAVYRAHLGRADTLTLDVAYYRTCVPGVDPGRALCLFIDASSRPPAVRPDPNPIPNARFFARAGPAG